MRHLVPVLAALAIALPMATPSLAAESTTPRVVQAAQSWPSYGQRDVEWSHRYEHYNTATGDYIPVDPRTVPDRVARGEWIYDRTAGIWYNHPSVPDYSYGRGDSYGPDRAYRLDLPRRHRYEVYEPYAPSYVPVDVTTVPGRIERGEWIYDRTAQAWVAHPSIGLNPRYVADGRARWDERHRGWDRFGR